MLEPVVHVVEYLRGHPLHVEHVLGGHEACDLLPDEGLSRAARPLHEQAHGAIEEPAHERQVDQLCEVAVAGDADGAQVRADLVHEVPASECLPRGLEVLGSVGRLAALAGRVLVGILGSVRQLQQVP